MLTSTFLCGVCSVCNPLQPGSRSHDCFSVSENLFLRITYSVFYWWDQEPTSRCSRLACHLPGIFSLGSFQWMFRSEGLGLGAAQLTGWHQGKCRPPHGLRTAQHICGALRGRMWGPGAIREMCRSASNTTGRKETQLIFIFISYMYIDRLIYIYTAWFSIFIAFDDLEVCWSILLHMC